MRHIRESIQGTPFNDVLNLLHGHAISGVPDDGASDPSDPFTLSMLDRELIAYALALYYQCKHCQEHHTKAIERERKLEHSPEWEWQAEVVKTVLFLRLDYAGVSKLEQEQWKVAWRKFAERIHYHHASLACYIAFAIGVARMDEHLMHLSFASLKASCSASDQSLLGVLRDIDRLVVFMKAATSKNRTDPIIRALLAECDIKV